MTPPILFHVGYHKTATTWMQRMLFTPEHGYRQVAGHEEAFEHVVRPHGLRFDPEPMRETLLRGMAALKDGEVPVLSSEILSGHPFQGGHESDVYAERLARIMPDARILISIRSQTKILPSVYMQYLLRGGTMPYDRFFEGSRELGYFGFTPDHFEYDLLVAHYQRLFGRDKVHVVTQESLARDMQAAAREVADFSGAQLFDTLQPAARKVHAASYPEYAAAVLRRVNHVQESTLVTTPIIKLGETPRGLYRASGYVLRSNPVARIFGQRKPVSDYVRRRFAGHFDASNRRLAEICPAALDLSAYR
jgi:hypothetical protein